MAAIIEIHLECHACRRDCRVRFFDGTSSAMFRCSACGHVLLEAKAIEGYVYVLSHPKLKGFVKVGFTKRQASVEVQELSRVSGLPEHFVLEATFASSSPEKHTAEIHKRLASRRVRGMEYFDVDLPVALKVVQQVVQSGVVRNAAGSVLSEAEAAEPSQAPALLWCCGLCKHEWTMALTPDRCPLCDSGSIVCLSAAAWPAAS